MTFLQNNIENLKQARPTHRVGKDSIDYRIYQWWLTHGGSVPRNGENFCHYVRVLLRTLFLWMPLYPIKKYILGPIYRNAYTILIAALALYFIGVVIVLGIKGGWETILIGAGIIVVSILAIVAVSLIWDRLGKSTKFNTFTKWFLHHRTPVVLTPVGILVIITSVVVGLLVPDKFLFGVVVVAVISAGLAVIAGIILGIVILHEKLEARPKKLRTINEAPVVKQPKSDRGSGTVSLLWQVIKALKNRYACPIVEFPKTNG